MNAANMLPSARGPSAMLSRQARRKACNGRKPQPLSVRCSAVSTNGSSSATKPSQAETARTIMTLVSEGTLSTLTADGAPVGTPVSYTLDKAGAAWVALPRGAPEISHLKANGRCSLMVQPSGLPARAVASVTLVGRMAGLEDTEATSYRLDLDKALYFGGLDESPRMHEVAADDYMAAEPDVLRTSAAELVKLWNEERAEDIYRIVSQAVKVPLSQMVYAELLWVDRLGMYVSSEVDGQQPSVVRVPFLRPVLDERDARSVITMAAQIAWEEDRPYTPAAPPAAVAVATNN